MNPALDDAPQQGPGFFFKNPIKSQSFSLPNPVRQGKGPVRAPGWDKYAAQSEAWRRREQDISRHLEIVDAYGFEASLLDGIVIVLVSIVCGAGYALLAFGHVDVVSVFVGAGILNWLLFSGIVRSKALQTPFTASRTDKGVRQALSSWIAAFALFLVIVFTMKTSSGLSSGGLLTFFLAGAAAVAALRTKALPLLARAFRRSALDGQDVIVIGPRNSAALAGLIGDLRATLDHEPLPVVFDGACGDSAWPQEVKRTLSHARRLAHNAGPGKILIMSHDLSRDRLDGLVAELAVLPRAICIIPDESTADFLRQKRTAIGGSIAVEIQPAPQNTARRSAKRILDVIFAFCLLVVLAPIMAAIAIVIKWDSSGPVFFCQTRTGYRGQTFGIFKFRTMTVRENGPVLAQAQRGDSRVTRVGRFLRRSSLDELPQLFNVLAGDMSLVGPRPHAVAHDKSYALQIPNYTLRQHVLPGITGWAQVNGFRGETATVDAMHRRVEYDVWYARNYSLGLDIQIMVRTFFEVVRARNAY